MKKLKNWLLDLKTKYKIGFLLVFLLGMCIFILRSFNLSDAEMGFISAIMGGLVGGGFTLMGVQLTLENQYKKDFIDRYPVVKVNTEIILKIIEKLNRSITHSLESDDEYRFVSLKKILIEIEPNLIEYSIKSGGIIHYRVYKIINHIKYIDSKMQKGITLRKGELGDEIDYMIHSDILIKFKYDINNNLEQIIKELNKEERIFETYTKI